MRVAAIGGHLPFDVAFAADDGFVLAWLVANGENNQAIFDWELRQWATKA